jgi:stage V sporulation protein AF
MKIDKKLDINLQNLKETLGIGESFDVISREIRIADKRAALIFIDGFAKDDIMQRIMEDLAILDREDILPNTIEKLLKRWVAYIETNTEDDFDKIIISILSGTVALIVDGEAEAIIIDAREYPARSPEEPDIERVTRGSRDGFVETIVFNTALIRRRIRDPKLRIELVQAGKRSVTDIAIVYIKDIANPQLIEDIKGKLNEIIIDGLPMAEKSVEEFIVGGAWNPFPMVRYTERPDVAAIHILEGHVAIIVDTSPSVILAPVTFFHHLQHAEEYRQSAFVGAYLRWVRFVGVISSILVPPLWLGLVLQKEFLPEALKFIGPKEIGNIPLYLQLLIAEIGVDLVRMASIHTPTPLATALGIIAAFMIGEVAAKVGLFTPEIILYMAIAAVGTFATPSYEMSLSLRLSRILLIILVAVFKLPGLAAGLVVLLIFLATRKSFGIPYMWPLIPFNFKALLDILFRKPVPVRFHRPSILHTRDSDPRPEGDRKDS